MTQSEFIEFLRWYLLAILGALLIWLGWCVYKIVSLTRQIKARDDQQR